MTQPGGRRSGPDPKFMVPYEGSVTRRDDPENRGRIILLIPGLIEPETPEWVLPIGGSGGGSAQRGHIESPDVGANVVVIFIQGNPDKPRYLVGPWGIPGGTSDAPTGHAVDGDDRQNAVTEDEEWSIQRDSRTGTGKPVFQIESKNEDTKIELNANSANKFVEIDSGDGQKLSLKALTQEAILDSGAGPSLTLDGITPSVALQLGSGPKLELFTGGFALSAGSSPEFAATGGKAKVGDRNATEKMMLGTTYRVDEATFLNAFATAVHVFASAAKLSTDPTLAAAATALETSMSSPPISSSKVRTDGSHTGYLSQNVDVQD